MDLIRRIRELSLKCEFLNAGERAEEKLQAALFSAEIDRLYVTWGLQELTGLEVDGVAATPELLVETGPRGAVPWIVDAIKAECGLRNGTKKTIVAFHFCVRTQPPGAGTCRKAGLKSQKVRLAQTGQQSILTLSGLGEEFQLTRSKSMITPEYGLVEEFLVLCALVWRPSDANVSKQRHPDSRGTLKWRARVAQSN
jgi:hypothetical protein